MSNMKHVGQIKNTQKRVVVMFRELPGDPDHCLVVDTDALPDWMHDGVINAVESPGAQQCANFYEYAQRTVFADGTNMLNTLHAQDRLSKQATTNIVMTPNNSVKLPLNELNDLIREQTGGAPVVSPDDSQLGVASSDAARKPLEPSTAQKADVVDNTAIAQNMLSQAEQFRAEAERLTNEAYEMEPSLKPKRGRKKAAPKKAAETAQ